MGLAAHLRGCALGIGVSIAFSLSRIFLNLFFCMCQILIFPALQQQQHFPMLSCFLSASFVVFALNLTFILIYYLLLLLSTSINFFLYFYYLCISWARSPNIWLWKTWSDCRKSKFHLGRSIFSTTGCVLIGAWTSGWVVWFVVLAHVGFGPLGQLAEIWVELDTRPGRQLSWRLYWFVQWVCVSAAHNILFKLHN